MGESVFSQQVLRWFDQYGRKGLPWQQPRTAYRVWLSEIMLQQTQVKTVIPYFLKFIDHFPTVHDLAGAKEDDVMSLWAGLGYYARARNLHRCAKTVVSAWQGVFPDNVDDLQSLPGIGRSTAGAIVAQAYGKRAVILDGNVKRVLCRYRMIAGWPGTTSVQKRLWQLADELTPEARVADYTQAMMDLGATCCTRSHPRCVDCPVRSNCQAYAQSRVADFPEKKPRKVLPVKTTHMLVCRYRAEILMYKRPPAGLWGSLWCLPELEGPLSDEQLRHVLEEKFGLDMLSATAGTGFRHSFSHFHLDIRPWHIQVEDQASTVREACFSWFHPETAMTLGIPRPVERIIQTLG